jgi:hypothetical protein
MTARQYRANDVDNYVAYDSELLEQHAHEIVTKQLLPRMAKQATKELQTIKTPVFLFQRLKSGRRCSCFEISASPSTICRACWGTGIVGGYNKWGTNLWVLDVTHPNVRTVGVAPDYSEQPQQTPRRFGLAPGVCYGYLDARFCPETNLGKIDTIHTFGEHDGTNLQAFLRAPSDTDWVDFTNEEMERRLLNRWIDVRFTFQRATPKAPSPKLGSLYFRYRRKADCTLLVDVPRNENSRVLAELGAYDDFKTRKMFTDNVVRTFTTEDIVAELNVPNRWKIISVNEFAPEKLLVAWELDTCLVQKTQAANLLPLGY